MRKITLLIGFVLMSCYSYAQIPSIKQASRHELSKKDNEDIEITNKNDRAELERSARLSLQVLALLKPEDTTFTINGRSHYLDEDEDKIISLIVDSIFKDKDKVKEDLKKDYLYQKLRKRYIKGEVKSYKRKRDSIYSLLRADTENIELRAELIKIKDNIKNQKDVLTEIKKHIKEAKDKPWIPSSFFPSCTYYQQGFYNRLYSKKSDRDFYFVNNAALQINNNANTIESELTAAFLGPFRVSFGTLISNSGSNEEAVSEGEEEIESTDETQAFQRLISGGGNIFLNVEFPLYFAEAGPWIGYVNAYGKGSADFSQISNDIDTSTANGTFGGNFYTSVSTEKNEFNFFANINYGVYFGGDEFYNALKLDSDKDKFFGFGQLIVGVTVFNNVRFSFTTNTFGSDEALRSGNIVFGIQVLSGFFEGN